MFVISTHLDGGTLRPGPDGRIFHRPMGAGPNFVMPPGFGGNVRTWEVITPNLAQTCQVHWVDPLGHRLSDKPRTATRGAHAQADRLWSLLPSQVIERPLVLASSAGSQIAKMLAADHLETVAGLVLIDPLLMAGVSQFDSECD